MGKHVGWVAASVAAIAGVAVGPLPRPALAAEEPKPPAATGAPVPGAGGVPVTIATATRETVPIYVSGIGTVQAYRSVLVRPRVDGTLEKISYVEGQAVKPGDVLAEIDPRPYAAVLAQAQAKKAADEAMLSNANRDMLRYSNLARSDFASHQQVDTQSATVLQAQASIQGDDAAIASAALNLSFCRIVAPIEGVVGLKLVDIGNLVHANDAGGLVTITQIHPISVVFTLPQDELPAVQAAIAASSEGSGSGGNSAGGNTPAGSAPGARPQVAAFVSGTTTALDTGELLTVDNAVDTATGTIRLKATFANAQSHLWPGQFVDARLRLRLEPGVVAVPPAAVQHGPSGLFVYLLRPDGTVARQTVTEGYEDRERAVISAGLEPGAKVVVAGQSRLQDGTRVAARQATDTRATGVQGAGSQGAVTQASPQTPG